VLVAVPPRRGRLLRQEKDEASPIRPFAAWDSLNAFILHLPGVKVFVLWTRAGLAAGASPKQSLHPALVSQYQQSFQERSCSWDKN
jgi:hypothetical protein